MLMDFATESPRTKLQPLARLAGVLIVLALGACLLPRARAQAAPSACGALQNGYGPLDYRTDRGPKLSIVEEYHFTPEVEALVRGATAPLGGDLDYTLRAYPNHHRALISMMRLGEKTKSAVPPSAKYSVECYFDRAIRFRRDDATVRMIYAMYLYSKARAPDAVRQLEVATELASDNPFTHYNIGLVFLDNRDYQRALVQAHRSSELGFTRTELKDRLVAAGKWVEPAAKAAAAEPAASQPAEVPQQAASEAK